MSKTLKNQLFQWMYHLRKFKYRGIYRKFQNHTMIAPALFEDNLELAFNYRFIPGAFVECGVWEGGMTAGMATLIGKTKDYYLFDSFEGLPDAGKMDGQMAKDYQDGKYPEIYHDNCKANMETTDAVMKRSEVDSYKLIKGYFEDSLKDVKIEGGIGILRLDGDWYDSIKVCLEQLYDQVNEGGIIILDDYNAWDGCALAVHDFLSERKIPMRIREFKRGVFYMQKQAFENYSSQ